MFLSKVRSGAAIAVIALAYAVPAPAATDVVTDHTIAVMAVASTQACAKKHPEAGITLEKFLTEQKADITDEMAKHIRDVATNPMYEMEVKQSTEFFNSKGGQGLLDGLCDGFITAK
ncbi:hypothetical protein FGE05_08840 [Pseudomonas sp. ICMP22404]|uniref:hypothetical protein n=1 Tax=Pseudomonas sp. ICMP22404 TaxID=2583807 RepID=UPI00111AAA0F|nr:hypothetical protein [Pseudomonas sp. ICMP22404]TNF83350.1 hypothetical protein FGE05_08840 [Pseudomonas sp. ICMP22404]